MSLPNLTRFTAGAPDKTRSADLRANLALLSQIEASLQASQKALLTRDLAGIEQGIREQTEWQRTLAAFWAAGSPCGENTPLRTEGNLAYANIEDESELGAKLRAMAARVLALGRVQILLLGRAQRSLTTLANLLAGPAACYDPIRPALPSPVAHRAAERSAPCRV